MSLRVVKKDTYLEVFHDSIVNLRVGKKIHLASLVYFYLVLLDNWNAPNLMDPGDYIFGI